MTGLDVVKKLVNYKPTGFQLCGGDQYSVAITMDVIEHAISADGKSAIVGVAQRDSLVYVRLTLALNYEGYQYLSADRATSAEFESYETKSIAKGYRNKVEKVCRGVWREAVKEKDLLYADDFESANTVGAILTIRKSQASATGLALRMTLDKRFQPIREEVMLSRPGYRDTSMNTKLYSYTCGDRVSMSWNLPMFSIGYVGILPSEALRLAAFMALPFPVRRRGKYVAVNFTTTKRPMAILKHKNLATGVELHYSDSNQSSFVRVPYGIAVAVEWTALPGISDDEFSESIQQLQRQALVEAI